MGNRKTLLMSPSGSVMRFTKFIPSGSDDRLLLPPPRLASPAFKSVPIFGRKMNRPVYHEAPLLLSLQPKREVLVLLENREVGYLSCKSPIQTKSSANPLQAATPAVPCRLLPCEVGLVHLHALHHIKKVVSQQAGTPDGCSKCHEQAYFEHGVYA